MPVGQINRGGTQDWNYPTLVMDGSSEAQWDGKSQGEVLDGATRSSDTVGLGECAQPFLPQTQLTH